MHFSGIEMIDFSEDEGEDDSEEMEDKFFKMSPQKRVIEALQTSPWPNIKMKKDKEDRRVSAVAWPVEEMVEGSFKCN